MAVGPSMAAVGMGAGGGGGGVALQINYRPLSSWLIGYR